MQKSANKKLSKLFPIVTLFITTLIAQPANAQPEVEAMQKQLAALQAQISSMKKSKSAAANDPFGSDRVKTVGTKRVPQPRTKLFDDTLHIRLYDLSDIFVVSPHYPAIQPNEVAGSGTIFQSAQNGRTGQSGGGFGGGGQGGGGGGVFSLPPARVATAAQEAQSLNMESAQISMPELVKAIKSTVSPDLWGDNTFEAKIQFLGNTLLISATEDMHQQISNLLDLFREHWGKLRTISVQTYWIRSDATQAKELLSQTDQEEIGAGVVDAQRWEKFLAAAKAEKRLSYTTTLTGHNNQTLHSISGRQRQLVVDAVPFEASKTTTHAEHGQAEEISISGFKPTRLPVHDGAAIQVTPLATRGGNFVVIDLHAKVNEFLDVEEDKKTSIFSYLPGGEKIEVKLDSADYVAYRMSTTIRCPKEQVVLAGGMTYDSTDADQPNLFLFVKATVHTINEDKSDWKKGSTGKK
ncbi:MAG: hypothetical protein AB8B55_05480 [Mariniblastus sp.]